jgi:histidinol-phosphate aminotransferase
MAPYVPGMREEQVRALCEVDYLVKVSSNESPSSPFESAQTAGREALVDLNRYPEGGCIDLREMLSQRLAVSPDCLVIGNGSNELLMLLAMATLNPGDEVVYGWPSFIVYPLMCQLTDAKAIEVPLNDAEQFDLDAILAAITPATKLVLLCSPNNPTGTWYSREAFEAFMDAVPDHVLVVVDEAYFEFATDTAYPNALDWFDGERPLCIFRTFSKIYAMAGIRCGYAVMPTDLIDALNKVRAPFNVNSVAQSMAMASLADEAELDKRILDNAEQRDRLEQIFDRLGISYAKSQTNFVWIHTPKAQDVFDALLRRGVIVRSFGQGNALRVGVGSTEETTQIIEAFEQLRRDGLI